jgi:hypothetical protein
MNHLLTCIRLAVGYSNGLLKILNIAQGYNLILHSVQLEEGISSLDVAVVEKDTWVIFVGGEKTGKVRNIIILIFRFHALN